MQEFETAPTVGRRDVLRRGATLGAALAISGPLVQRLGQVSAFALSSPPPGEPGSGGAPSHFQLLVVFGTDATRRGIKWDGAWGALHRQGNRCFDMTSDNFQPATNDQVASLASVIVHTTPRGYEVTIPNHITVVEAAATFDGGQCYYAGQSGGPYRVGNTWVFPKPAHGRSGNDVSGDAASTSESASAQETFVDPEGEIMDPELVDPQLIDPELVEPIEESAAEPVT